MILLFLILVLMCGNWCSVLIVVLMKKFMKLSLMLWWLRKFFL